MSKLIESFKRNSPPGLSLKQEYAVFVIGNIVSAVVSIFAFLLNYIRCRAELFEYVGDKRLIIVGAIIPPFYNLIDIYFSGFIFVALVLLSYVIYHYSYYRQGSMSVYLMRRLPNKIEMHKRAWTVPLLASIGTIAIAIAVILFCYIIYFLATPKACLPYNIWR